MARPADRQDIVKSVTKPATQLGIVAYTFVITVVIYAQFGLRVFEDTFVYDPDADDENPSPGCHSVVSCFWLILYQGVPAGSMENVQDVINNRDKDFLSRVLYDLSFFVLVGILLFNVITGARVPSGSCACWETFFGSDSLCNRFLRLPILSSSPPFPRNFSLDCPRTSFSRSHGRHLFGAP